MAAGIVARKSWNNSSLVTSLSWFGRTKKTTPQQQRPRQQQTPPCPVALPFETESTTDNNNYGNNFGNNENAAAWTPPTTILTTVTTVSTVSTAVTTTTGATTKFTGRQPKVTKIRGRQVLEMRRQVARMKETLEILSGDGQRRAELAELRRQAMDQLLQQAKLDLKEAQEKIPELGLSRCSKQQ